MRGAVAVVSHYNLFSRLITERVCRLWGIPLMRFYDDFGAKMPLEVAQPSLWSLTGFCEKLIVFLETAKSDVCSEVTFSGPLGHLPCAARGCTSRVSLPREKADSWAPSIDEIAKSGAPNPQYISGSSTS